ncbi:Osmosensitive K channel His kinase sensor [Chthoniobacter flavus Ellin428]|uniref:Osmosensitive K channel His kinase sensor n=1 Tax=Chthoniobacter flavus Ellin428 TaxID=497964 RepID=B4CY71_9BACT|nr:universal stress protein [Chthoniobacter flavus]EDY21219.1 Osmosensitive K channel His kinase sensor [Chthoniobacter flavus Ellin428]TCO87588.1 two-component system sensor histidine kinase KdpD [Chthoniobacter flavus]
MLEADPAAKTRADDFLAIIRKQQAGKLKIYLGPCPGVGKTYSMLVEGNRLKKGGVDVVVGYVEPHERPETSAQIGDLEIIPPRLTTYHGIALKEMDVDAVIARRPTVALVDELAHTNAPDSKNRKRYEDVEDLLRAGINVISTVNIQHLESLYNFVEETTGVRVKERVPDEILTKADQIVNIDLPAEDLQERLQAGKIYPKERIEAALANFFTQKNLTRLREMTLTETANFLDRKQRDAENDQNVSALGQVMVAISSQGPDPGRLLRKTARLAAQLNAQWYAVYVRTPSESAVRIDAETQRRVNDTLETAQKMGGLVFSMKGESVAKALVSFAREYGITHIVVGRPGPKRLRQYFQSSLHEVLLQELPDVDLVVV